MKVIIAGTRGLDISVENIEKIVVSSGFEITELVCGMSGRVDLTAKEWADEKGIEIKKFHPAWSQYGRSAGPIRNHAMGDYADALIAIWDLRSNGTHDMITYMQRLNKPVTVVRKG